MFSSPSNTRTQKSSAFTPRVQPIASRRWSRSGRGYRCFGSIAPGVARGLKLRHDHGSNYMSSDFQGEIKCLGIEASPSFVREPEGNGVAERFIRTLKENLLWVRTFKTIEELRAELVAFARRYNETWPSRGMDTKRPRGSERSKPCHQLRLTRRRCHLTLGRLNKRSRVSQNRSVLHSSPYHLAGNRNAARPVNAILNYAYAALESEIRSRPFLRAMIHDWHHA